MSENKLESNRFNLVKIKDNSIENVAVFKIVDV